ncbi:hypothetical protein CSAL01_11476 [Colletotrichum salicis]|uniref:Uncharacterized protein n=1 Tax=Colletotrichum salicis TaxID=1209931 RepID=A0A135V6E3_9PEZI|nr:hypothetical protein CSAL01_11476 [Colletotrichum salicis]
MSHLPPFRFGNGKVSNQGGSTTTALTATLTGDTRTYGICTPSPTDDSTLPELVGTPSAPEPTVLLREIQQAADDISQLVGRFGYKMAETLTIHSTKEALFTDQKSLRLPCLKYADNFSCVATRLYAKPINYTTSAPLLWWLWDELLEYLLPTGVTRGCRLDFKPAFRTDIALPYAITIDISSKTKKTISSSLRRMAGYSMSGAFSMHLSPDLTFPSRKGTASRRPWLPRTSTETRTKETAGFA